MATLDEEVRVRFASPRSGQRLAPAIGQAFGVTAYWRIGWDE